MQSREILFIVELVLWTPTLAVGIYVCTRQGFKKQLGWLSLAILGIFRILGSSTGIAAITDPSEGLIEASIISSSVGLISLVGSVTGLTLRIQQNLPPTHSLLGPLPVRVIHIATVAALVLSILAGSDFASTNSTSDIKQGRTFIKVALGLLSGVFVFVSSLALFTHAKQRRHIVAPGESRLLTVTVIVLPFIAVRLIYGWLSACLSENSAFSLFNNATKAIIARALMQILMELMAAWTILWAGCTVPKSQVKEGPRHDLAGGYGGGTRGGKTAMLENGLRGVWGGQGRRAEGSERKSDPSVDEV